MRCWRNDERTVNGGRERMAKRLLGGLKRLWNWVPVLDLIAFFFLAVCVLLLAWVAFDDSNGCNSGWIYDRLGVTEKTEAISMLGLAIAGVVAFWGVVVANRRAKAMADAAKAATDSARAADNTTNVAEAGNRQRAFKDGVEHLGSDKAFVRQGGAHALFHLALEDEKLSASIAGVLCAHIRETTGDEDYQKKNKDKPSAEMQSLLRLLFMTETADEERLAGFWKDVTPDLNGGYFCGVELEGARFRGARLGSAQFKGARLTGARFQKAVLDGAQFQRAWLRGTKFQGAWMRETRFHAAYLGDAQFQGANLDRAQFQGARLFGSQFQGAWLYMAGFQQVGIGIGYQALDAQNNGAILGKLEKRVEKCIFHGISSEFLDPKGSFEQRIKDRTDKESDFSGVIFSGGVTNELLAEVKKALEVPVKRGVGFLDDPNFIEELIQGLESEISELASNTLPKDVIAGSIAGSYGKEDAKRWIRAFREATATAPETNQAA